MREESSIDSRGQDMQQGGWSCAERRKKPREQGNGRRRWRRRTRQRRATRQRTKRQGRERRERVGRPRGGMKVAARIGERLWSLRSLCRVVGVVGAGHRFPGHRLLFFCEKRKGLIMHTPGSCHDVSDCDTAATYGDYHSPPARLSAARIQPQPAGAAQYDRGSLDGNDSPRISP